MLTFYGQKYSMIVGLEVVDRVGIEILSKLIRIGLIDEGIFEQEKCVCPTKSSVKSNYTEN